MGVSPIEARCFLAMDPTGSKLAGKTVEIDSIAYANFNIYLMELKWLNLAIDRVKKHVKDVAPQQCAKYSSGSQFPSLPEGSKAFETI